MVSPSRQAMIEYVCWKFYQFHILPLVSLPEIWLFESAIGITHKRLGLTESSRVLFCWDARAVKSISVQTIYSNSLLGL
jgi:hypothetical protein